MDLATRIDEAERMAKADCSIETIIAVTSLSAETASCIKQRIKPDYSSSSAFETLKRNVKD